MLLYESFAKRSSELFYRPNLKDVSKTPLHIAHTCSKNGAMGDFRPETEAFPEPKDWRRGEGRRQGGMKDDRSPASPEA